MYRNVVNNILVYGDSNTWGLIPGSSERYPQESGGFQSVKEREQI